MILTRALSTIAPAISAFQLSRAASTRLKSAPAIPLHIIVDECSKSRSWSLIVVQSDAYDLPSPTRCAVRFTLMIAILSLLPISAQAAPLTFDFASDGFVYFSDDAVWSFLVNGGVSSPYNHTFNFSDVSAVSIQAGETITTFTPTTVTNDQTLFTVDALGVARINFDPIDAIAPAILGDGIRRLEFQHGASSMSIREGPASVPTNLATIQIPGSCTYQRDICDGSIYGRLQKVPEPASLALFSVGLVVTLARRRRSTAHR